MKDDNNQREPPIDERGVTPPLNPPVESPDLESEHRGPGSATDPENEANEDGMDITICSFDKETHSLTVACANHTAFFIQDNKFSKIDNNIVISTVFPFLRAKLKPSIIKEIYLCIFGCSNDLLSKLISSFGRSLI